MNAYNWASRQVDAVGGETEHESDRFYTHLRTTIFSEDSLPMPVLLKDISSGGFMGECPNFVRIGSCISIHLPVIGSVEALVVWALQGRLGARFFHQISSCYLAKHFAPQEEGRTR
ncbi:MAG TPA: PilZ domain-containing protein [Allosphingosinicella sp.]|uniref:PilZ domain-containing protein n=1 Tax=Allosphingosinicella sp. TaxID=2823234 RepID=UPI002ED9D907